MSPRRPGVPPTVAIRLDVIDRPDVVRAIVERIVTAGGTIRTVATVRRLTGEPARVELEVEVEGLDEDALVAALADDEDLRDQRLTRALDRVFGKRVIVVG